MKTRRTIYHLIVDKSGSMSDCIDSTINGYNEQINQIRRNQAEFIEEDIVMGLTTFNHHVYHHNFNLQPNYATHLDIQNYKPEGSTALLDAIGMSVSNLESQIHESNLPTTVVVVILTDGYENASNLYNLVQVRNSIKRLEETGKWTFSFIGATLDAVDVAMELNIKSQNSMSFNKSNMKTAVWDKLDNSLLNYFKNKRAGKNTNDLL